MNVVIIGLGKAGLQHAAACQRMPEVALVAAADPSPTASEAASKLGIPLFSDYRAMLERSKPAAAIVSVPHSQLSAIAIECASRGLHLLLEKPMSATVAEARAVVDAARAAGVRLMVNFVHRFRVEYRQAKSFIDAGVIGAPVMIEDRMTWGRSPLPSWVWQRALAGGGLMMYNGVHSMDRLAWLAGSRIARVTGVLGTLCYPIEVEDTAIGTVVFENGSVGVVIQHKSLATTTLNRWETTVWGTEGAITVSQGGMLEVMANREKVRVTVQEDDRWLGALREFVSAVTCGRDPEPGGEDGARALAVVMALYEAARTGRAQDVAAETETTRVARRRIESVAPSAGE
jgi:predicted dehydrogenase